MTTQTSVIGLNGAAGRIDVAVDRPTQGAVRGIAVIAHPHPLYGGTRDNKVVQTMARALLALGFVCWRPDFRGVGDSAGVHDEGRGETDDLIVVVDAARAAEAHTQPAIDAEAGGAELPLVLAGFSFGTFVLSRVAARLAQAGKPASRLVFIGAAASRFTIETVPADTLVIHGELDDTVPLQSVLDWARPQDLPVVVIPGADHFFHHRLTGLKQLLLRELR
jgi:alpha/beta superfamily hydrolase